VSKREIYYDQAEALFVKSGHSIERISQLLPVSAKTLYEWRQYGDWTTQKKAHLASKRNVADILRDRLAEKIAALESGNFSAGDVDEIAKISATIDRMERNAYDLKAAGVEVMGRFGKYLRATIKDPNHLQEISRHIQGFFEWLETNA